MNKMIFRAFGSLVGRWLNTYMKPVFSLLLVFTLLAPYVFSTSDEPGKFIITDSDPWIPNIAHSDFIQGERLESKKNGIWSDPEVWGGIIPGSQHTIVVHHDVTFDSIAKIFDLVIYPKGKLSFHTQKKTELSVGTIMVLEDGTLTIGTENNPIADDVSAEIIFSDRSINTGMDPAQYSNGLLVFGRLEVYGPERSPSWSQLTVEPKSGDMALQLKDPVAGWKEGDRLLLVKNIPKNKETDENDDIHRNTEDLILSKISADKKQVILSTFLSKEYDIENPNNAYRVQLLNGVVRKPYLANLTRNINFSSENPFGIRGHTLFMGKASVNIHHAGFLNLGRSRNTMDPYTRKLFLNGLPIGMGSYQPARYPVHFYHLNSFNFNKIENRMLDDIREFLEQGGWQYKFVDNVVTSTNGEYTPFRGGLCINDSNFGLVAGNLIYNNGNFGIWTKDGNERYNLLKGNFVVQIHSLSKYKSEHTSGMGIQLKSQLNWMEDNITEAVVIADQYNPIFMDNDLSKLGNGFSLSKLFK